MEHGDKPLQVRCVYPEKFPAKGFGGFRNGKVYPAKQVRAGSGALLSVVDDNGHERFVIPGKSCPHLWDMVNWDTNRPGEWVGRFELVEEEAASV